MSRSGKSVVFSRVDIENPGTWMRFKKKMCDSCIAGCCTLVVEITKEDLVRLELATEWEVENSIKPLIKSLKKAGIIKRYNAKSEKFVLEQKSNGDCQFLDDNRRCSMYELRPNVCREHPVVKGPKTGFCPYIRKGTG